MFDDLEKRFMHRFQITDEKLDLLTKRVSSIERRFNDENKKRTPNNGARCHHCPSTTHNRNRLLKRSAAVWHSEDDLDTSSSDGSFIIKMEGNVNYNSIILWQSKRKGEFRWLEPPPYHQISVLEGDKNRAF
jgi:hypothetical protein